MALDEDPRRLIKSDPLECEFRFPSNLNKSKKIGIKKWIMDLLERDFKNLNLLERMPDFPVLVKMEDDDELVFQL